MEHNDKQFVRKVRTTLSKGQLIKGGIKELYSILKEEYPADTSERTTDRKYMKRFFSWRRINDVLEITEIYGEPIPTDPPKEKKYRTKTDIKGYTDEAEFYERAAKVFRPGEVYKGYSEFCSLLNVPKATGEAKINQLKDWKRFFKWKEISQRQWKFISINPDIGMKILTSKKSEYGELVSDMMVKNLKEKRKKLEEQHKITVTVDESGNETGNILFKRSDLSEFIGMNTKELNKYVYKYDDKEELIAIDTFVENYDKKLTNKGIIHTRGDIEHFKKQMNNRSSSVITSGIIHMIKQGLVIRQFYTELYYDMNAETYDVLMLNKRYDSIVNHYKSQVLKEENLKSWEQIYYFPEHIRNKFIKKLNSMIKNELNIIVFHGYWLTFNAKRLDEVYSEKDLSNKDTEKMRKTLMDIITKKQEHCAQKVEENSKYISDKGSTVSKFSCNYIEVSNDLFSSVFQPVNKDICNIFLSAKDENGHFKEYDGHIVSGDISTKMVYVMADMLKNWEDK